MSYYIYKYVRDGEIKYIGKTIDVKKRYKQHKSEKKFMDFTQDDVFYFECNSKTQMDALEVVLINAYYPVLNIAAKVAMRFNVCTNVISKDAIEWRRLSDNRLENNKRTILSIEDVKLVGDFNPILFSKYIPMLQQVVVPISGGITMWELPKQNIVSKLEYSEYIDFVRSLLFLRVEYKVQPFGDVYSDALRMYPFVVDDKMYIRFFGNDSDMLVYKLWAKCGSEVDKFSNIFCYLSIYPIKKSFINERKGIII